MTSPQTQQIAAATVTVVIIIIGIATLFIVFRRRILNIRERKSESNQAKCENIVKTGTIVRMPGMLLRQGSDLFATLAAPEQKNKTKPKFVPCEEHPGQLKVVNLPAKSLPSPKRNTRKSSLNQSTAQFTTHAAASRGMPDVDDSDIGLQDMENIPELDDDLKRARRVTHRPPKSPFTDGPRVNNLTN